MKLSEAITKVASAMSKDRVYPRMAKDIEKALTGGRKYPFSYLTGEAKEFAEALLSRNKDDIKEEFGDVMFGSQMLFHQNTGINFPMIGTKGVVKKFIDRFDMWKKIFGRYGVKFHQDYLEGGSNYRKPQKIRAALSMAGHNISDTELRSLETLVGGYEVPI